MQQLKLLVNLARVDGELVAQEKKYIHNIANANGFPETSVAMFLSQSHEPIIANTLTDDQRYDYIFSLVQLMKIDERLYQDEIKFCAKIASRLGYSQEVLFQLLMEVKSTDTEADKDSVKALIQSYLKKGSSK